MASGTQRPPQVEELRSYLEGVAKNLVDKLYGVDGLPWGTKLTELEDVCLDVRALLTEKMLQIALQRQAATQPQQPSTYRTCPSCQQPLTCNEAEPRLVQTRVGEAQWQEPEGYCPRCRRAFFPSVQKPGP